MSRFQVRSHLQAGGPVTVGEVPGRSPTGPVYLPFGRKRSVHCLGRTQCLRRALRRILSKSPYVVACVGHETLTQVGLFDE